MDFKAMLPFRTSGLARPTHDDPFLALRREMDRLFESFSREFPALSAWTPTALTAPGELAPRVNVVEDSKGLVITADLPGVEAGDVTVDLIDGVLSLRAEHKSEQEVPDESRKLLLAERTHGIYRRSFTLPFAADEANIKAEFANGVLTLHVPRAAGGGKQPTRIAVTAAPPSAPAANAADMARAA